MIKKDSSNITHPKKGSIVSNITNLIFWTVVIVFSYSSVTLIANDFDRTQMNFLGYSWNYVMSGSMEPTIMTGELVIAKQADFEDIEVGDIIIYKHTYDDGSSIPIIHRVIEKNSEYLLCKGDNNPEKDPWNIYPNEVRSIVVWYKNK